jgi:hypothetical protein
VACWTVRIEGAPFDIEDYPDWFPNGPVRATRRDDGIYILADRFEQLTDSTEVHESALGLLDELFAIVSLLQTNLQKPRIATIFREEDDGTRQGFVQVSARVAARSKARGSATVAGKEEGARGPTAAQRLAQGLGVDRHLSLAISLWADPVRTWPRLYRILEEVELYLGHPVSKEGWCRRNERERFTQSANHPAAAGADARHAERNAPPKKPLTLGEATAFVSEMLRHGLLLAGTRAI